MQAANMQQGIEEVQKGLDEVLKQHGYLRQGNFYHVLEENEDTLVFFCHFGVECVMLGHLLGISPMVLWHTFIAAPSSVTTICTEEREKGIASFRVSAFGDISHLYVAQEPPAFAGRFCETFSNLDQRH
jgi:probable phosphoglycerate mutase